MIEVKRVEVRDRGTFIPAVALRISGGPEDPLFARAGFGREPLVLLIHLEGEKCTWDPFHWSGGSRTMHEAHLWLQERWTEHRDGGVVDVEFLKGETTTQKMSEVSPRPSLREAGGPPFHSDR